MIFGLNIRGHDFLAASKREKKNTNNDLWSADTVLVSHYRIKMACNTETWTEIPVFMG